MAFKNTSEKIEQCIYNFFQEAKSAKIQYIVLCNYHKLPKKISHDIDLLAPKSSVKDLEDIFLKVTDKLGLFLTRRYGEVDRNLTIEAYDWNAGVDYPRCAIHIKTFLVYNFPDQNWPTLIWAEDVINETKLKSVNDIEIRILKPELEFGLILAQWLTKYNYNKMRYSSYLIELMDTKIIKRRLIKLFDQGDIEILRSALTKEGKEFKTVQENISWMSKEILSSLDLRTGIASIFFSSHKILIVAFNWVLYRLKKSGNIYSFCGPDGVGKTTVSYKVKEFAPPLLTSENSKIIIKHLTRELNPTRNIVILNRIRKGIKAIFEKFEPEQKEEIDPDKYIDHPKEGFVWRARQFIAELVDLLQYIIIWYGFINRLLYKGKVIILDRSVLDQLVCRPENMLFEKLVTKVVPKPDLVFLFNASPDTILKRKDELTKNKIFDYNIRINKLIEHSGIDTVKINAEPKIDTVAKEVLYNILKYINKDLRRLR